MTFLIAANGFPPGTIVQYTTDIGAGTAKANVDYTPVDGTFTTDVTGAGEAALVVDTMDDAIANEGDGETLYVTASTTAGASVSGTGTIAEDNDSAPTVSIANDTELESSGQILFPITISAESATPITVTYHTQDASAVAGEDYQGAQNATFTIPAFTLPSDVAKLVVPLLRDAWQAADESFQVTLDSASGAALGNRTAAGTIQQGPQPTVSIGDATQEEPASDSAIMNFPVTVTPGDWAPLKLYYYTEDGSATSPEDYQGIPQTAPASITIPAGATSANIPITIFGDMLDGTPQEQFSVVIYLASGSDALVSRDQAAGTILQPNGGEPTLSIAGDTQPETAGTITFTVSLSAPTTQQVQVQFYTFQGTATPDDDYTEVPADAPQTITFAPKDATPKTVTVNVLRDDWNANDEDFFGNLMGAVGATIAVGQAAGTITQGPPPTLAVKNATGTENGKTLNFPVTLSAPCETDTTVYFYTQDGSATSPDDYGGIPASSPRSIVIPAHETKGTITIAVNNDYPADDVPKVISSLFGLYEPQTQFTLYAYTSLDATKRQATGTIYDPNHPNAPVQQCTCSCGCGNVKVEPNPATGQMTMHTSLPIGSKSLAMVQSPDDSSDLKAAIQFGLTFLGLQQPHPIVMVPDQLSPDVANATVITAQLTLGGITGAPVYYSPAGYTAGATVVFAAQVDAGSLPTGSYPYTMTITEQYADGSTVVRTYNGQQNVENLDGSAAGAGWTLRGLPRLWPQSASENQSGGVSLSDGAGNLYFFTQNPDGSFTRPAGEPNFSTLVKNSDGTW